MIPLASFFSFFQYCFGYSGSFVLPYKYDDFFCSFSLKHAIGILMGIALNLYIALGNMYILTCWYPENSKALIKEIEKIQWKGKIFCVHALKDNSTKYRILHWYFVFSTLNISLHSIPVCMCSGEFRYNSYLCSSIDKVFFSSCFFQNFFFIFHIL